MSQTEPRPVFTGTNRSLSASSVLEPHLPQGFVRFLQRRVVRRSVALGLLASVVGFGVSVGGGALGWLLVFTAFIVVLFVALNLASDGMAVEKGGDEHQRKLTNAARARLWPLVPMTLAVVALIASQFPDAVPSMIWASVWVVYLLPLAFVAWTMPDPVALDD